MSAHRSDIHRGHSNMSIEAALDSTELLPSVITLPVHDHKRRGHDVPTVAIYRVVVIQTGLRHCVSSFQYHDQMYNEELLWLPLSIAKHQ